VKVEAGSGGPAH